MIHIFIGNDYTARMHALAQQRIRWQQKEYEILSFFSDETSEYEIMNTISHQTLFGEERAYILHGYLTKNGVSEALAQHTHAPIMCIEESLTAPQIQKITKTIGEDYCEVRIFKKDKEKNNAIFSLANDIRDRNPKNAWLTYQRLVADGFTLQQMIGTAWWQMKNMLLVQASPQNHGLKPFVADKAKAALAKYPGTDLIRKSQELLDIYHYGFDGGLENRFEEFLLKLAS
ncbi:hypothetical protein H6776_00435 [Candidatus Nomurabacteria bacterium]|nr:hypothetical protein [Candidatus Nomurabacteria bacterium]